MILVKTGERVFTVGVGVPRDSFKKADGRFNPRPSSPRGEKRHANRTENERNRVEKLWSTQ